MTGKIRLIKQALIERLGNIDDLTLYSRIPDSANVPCAWVAPHKSKAQADYQQIYGGGQVQYNFMIEVVTNRQDIETAQDLLDDYSSEDGPFLQRLHAYQSGDSLSDLIGENIEVFTASRYGSYKIGGAVYLGFQLEIQLSS